MNKFFSNLQFSSILIAIFFTTNIFAQADWEHFAKDDKVTGLVFLENSVVISTLGNGLEFYCYSGELILTQDMDDGMVSNNVNAIAKDNNGVIWIATDAGFAK